MQEGSQRISNKNLLVEPAVGKGHSVAAERRVLLPVGHTRVPAPESAPSAPEVDREGAKLNPVNPPHAYLEMSPTD